MNDKPKVDAYAILEFVGWVAEVPTYEKTLRRLRFVAEPLAPVSMPFVAYGALAQAFKAILHRGCLVQLQAVPTQIVAMTENGKVKVTEWDVRSMRLLGRRKTLLPKYKDLQILDGIMPTETEVEDIGHIDPERWRRFAERKGIDNDD